MNHVTSIGLDVHARSVSAAAFNPLTGEIVHRRFGYEPAELAGWILRFESPRAVYESGVTGFDLCRKLNDLGVDCVVGAVSKMIRSSAQSRQKNDRNDAEFLARLLSMRNIVEVMVPDEECEAMRDLVRAHDDMRQDLLRSRQRLTQFLMRKGRTFNERNAEGLLKSYWTRDHWAWIRGIEFDDEAANDTLALYISEARHLEAQKKQLENWIRKHAREPRFKSRVDALRCLKGVETVTAFTLVVEAGVFARFKNASAYSAWLGLNPSERSSGEKVARGGISKTGNSLCRRMLVEAAWHYPRATESRKAAPDPAVPLSIENHAAKATKRLVKRRRHFAACGKKPVVANCATARELACWVWSIGCMAEGVEV